LYHIVNGLVVFEYLVVLYLKPDLKAHHAITITGWSSIYAQTITSSLTLRKGIVLAVFGQILRSVAMIHASTNFSHTVAFRKRDNHQLVTDGVYRYVPQVLMLLVI
jgi:protein-S-isoprenylcysteine O-methyltransferase